MVEINQSHGTQCQNKDIGANNGRSTKTHEINANLRVSPTSASLMRHYEKLTEASSQTVMNSEL